MPTATSRPTFARSSLSPPGMEDRARLGGRGGLVAATRIGVAGATLNGVATVGAVQGTEVTARVETPAVESARLEPVRSEPKAEIKAEPAKAENAPELRRSTD